MGPDVLELWFRTWIDSDSNLPLENDENPFAEFATIARPELPACSTACTPPRPAP